MRNTILNLTLVFALGLYTGCLAADITPKAANDPGKDTSNPLKTLGNEVDKIEHDVIFSVKNLGTDNQKYDKNSKQSNDSEKDTPNVSNAVNALGNEADKVVLAISSSIKSTGKIINNMDRKEGSKDGLESSGNGSWNEFCNDVGKALNSMENFISNMCKQASEQIEKAQHKIGFDNRSSNSHNTEIVGKPQNK